MQRVSSNFRLKFFVTHLAVSVALVACAAGLILGVWYPGVLAQVEGVLPILGLLVLVDVCLGPLLTLTVANPRKPRRELWRDLSVIGMVQLAALGYGLHSAYSVRPAFVVFDINRFETVSAQEVDATGAGSAPEVPDLRAALLSRPLWVYAKPPDSPDERQKIVTESLSGGPEFKNLFKLYRHWPHDSERVRAALRPVDALGAQSSEVADRLIESGRDPRDAGYLSLLGRSDTAIVVIAKPDLSVLFAVPRRN